MKIAVIPNHTKDIGLRATKTLLETLSGRAEIFMSRNFSESGLPAVFLGEDLFSEADAVIVLGGDGTILQAAEPCAAGNIPIMGINLGTIGFMTEIEAEDIQHAVTRLLSGDYRIENRMLLNICVRKDENISSYIALNDLVLSKPDAQMISIDLFCNNEKMNAYIADGLIISTPTGSTGYSLSAGGPVADPTMELFIATPICAHRLSSRPALLNPQKVIRLCLQEDGNRQADVTIDGKVRERIESGDFVEITKSEKTIPLIRMGTQSFYDTLKQKLS